MSCWHHNLFRDSMPLFTCFNHKCLFFACPWRRCSSVGFWSWGSVESCCLYLGSRSLNSHVPTSWPRWSPTSSRSTAWSVCSWASPLRCGLLFCWSSSLYPPSWGFPSGSADCTWSHSWSFLRWVALYLLFVNQYCFLLFILWSQTIYSWTWISGLQVRFISAYERRSFKRAFGSLLLLHSSDEVSTLRSMRRPNASNRI